MYTAQVPAARPTPMVMLHDSAPSSLRHRTTLTYLIIGYVHPLGMNLKGQDIESWRLLLVSDLCNETD